MKNRPLLWIVSLLLATLAACKAQRPTEFLNIIFTPSVETEGHKFWAFELESCVDFEDPRIDDEFVRKQLLASIRAELEQLEFVYRAEPEPDFLVYYELRVADGGGLGGVTERLRGRIVIRDVATGRLIWIGERKKPAGTASSRDEMAVQIRLFAHELLQYTRKLE